IRYTIRMEPGVQTPEQTLALKSGSCRDTGWLLVQALRHLGLAARFVSGYLIQLKADVAALDGPSGTDVDFTDLHAWCEVFLPGAGWIGLDPTSGLMAGEGHIPVACTPEPTTAAPVSGAVDECEVSFDHAMSVTRIFESPRVTKPYTPEQWQAIDALGRDVDQHLKNGDVRLTMGGEPTFVSVDDREGAEWNTDALGPTKRGLATTLVHKLRERYGPGGFLHFGQGKWYPGEQLPRWALSIFWRADGEPCWSDPSLFADEKRSIRYNSDDAKLFVETLANKLGVGQKHILPGYEDTFYYLWRERRLPVNVDPFDTRLDDEMERLRLRRVFDQGLDHTVGYVLPIKREWSMVLDAPRWISGPWFFRDGRMYLIPGDSPMGYRLPLESLPWVSAEQYPYLHEHDPFAPKTPLASAATLRAQYGRHQVGHGFTEGGGDMAHLADGKAGDGLASSSTSVDPGREPNRFESAHWITRTALCVEVRNPDRSNGPRVEEAGDGGGVMYVFMPPMVSLDDYLDLLAAVEATAADLGMQIVLEGYPPPRDARLKMLQVTPDPGVIEVNIHPASNWAELVDHTEFLYQAAHETRLSTEKFMVDGRHTGTGGGNHFVLGGATPADSPFLRRPDLIPSLLTFWHNHPSLSYLFSGMFIGPTSQAPRVDEARTDQVYEVEIGLREVERQMEVWGHCPPWLIDRALRNLLIDATGNTHRSEFCIDKLYSPDGPTGRLGLLELRAFEMPPHAHMSLVQQLLLRALVAWFWREPYQGHGAQRLTRWGTTLHDRFLLPSFVEQDFDDVLTELAQAGFHFDPAWFAPHLEFRFPYVGEVAAGGARLTVRTALEPWHVMGEEGSPGGTVRYVDSSLERMEVRVTGLNGNRHVVTVNGHVLPLHPTGRAGEFVAGVRYRAWQPPSCLHPTIPSDAPLVIDLVDSWQHRSLGGCQYHVAHPGGRNHDTFPVNAYEAESRRLARFFRMGHTPGVMSVKPLKPGIEHPLTLDLRTARIGV
ncbi:MAG: transglutaminase family protein, partial [Rubrivivax sp.]